MDKVKAAIQASTLRQINSLCENHDEEAQAELRNTNHVRGYCAALKDVKAIIDAGASAIEALGEAE